MNWILWADIFFFMIVLVYGIWFTWFDKRLRIIMIHPDKRLSLHKVNLMDGKMFNLKDKKYVFDEKAVFVRNNRLMHSIYFFNNPKPIIITGDKGYKYTSQEIHKLLDTNFTMNLITPKIDVKKFVLGTAILIGIVIIVAVILHFTGVIDLASIIQETIGQKPAGG